MGTTSRAATTTHNDDLAGAVVAFVEQPLTLELVIAMWLDAKYAKSHSEKTRRAYRDALASFRAALGAVGFDLDSPQDEQIATVLQAWAGAKRRDGQDVKPATRNQRLAIVASFYRHAQRKRYQVRDAETEQLRLIHTPLDMVERGPVESASAGHLDEGTIMAKFDAIDTSKPIGARDLALLTLGIHTGRRLAELAALAWGDIECKDDPKDTDFGAAIVHWPRLKGGKTGSMRLEPEVADTLRAWREALASLGAELVTQKSPVWISLAHNGTFGHQLRVDAIADVCKRRLGTSKVHALRHSFAFYMLQSGAPVTTIQAQLGHKNVATTQRYLAKLDATRNPYGRSLVERLGGRRAAHPAMP